MDEPIPEGFEPAEGQTWACKRETSGADAGLTFHRLHEDDMRRVAMLVIELLDERAARAMEAIHAQQLVIARPTPPGYIG